MLYWQWQFKFTDEDLSLPIINTTFEVVDYLGAWGLANHMQIWLNKHTDQLLKAQNPIYDKPLNKTIVIDGSEANDDSAASSTIDEAIEAKRRTLDLMALMTVKCEGSWNEGMKVQ